MTVRLPMTPAEFDAACREVEEAFPALSATSGIRSRTRNAQVGGNPKSKHVLGIARDYVASTIDELYDAEEFAESIGLWAHVHDVGSGDHLHLQGLAPGDPPLWWTAKYGR
jgi:hypothetical protein